MNVPPLHVPVLRVRGWLVLGAAAAAAVVLVNQHYVLSPDKHRQAIARANAAAEAEQNSELRGQIGQMKAKETQIAAKSAELTAIATAIPPSPQEPELTDTIGQFAADTHVSVTKFSPSLPDATNSTTPNSTTTNRTASGSGTTAPVTAQTAYQSIPVSMNISGTYPNVATFIKDVENSTRLFTITSVALTPGSPLTSAAGAGQPGNTVTADLDANVFYATTNLTSIPADISALSVSTTQH